MLKEYKIQSKYNKVVAVCDEINLFMVENRICKSTADSFEICLIEALNNIIKHAYKQDFTKEIKIIIKIEEEIVSVSLIDNGLPRKNTEKAKLEYDPDDIENLPEGGMGLYIIENLMDHTKYESTPEFNKYTISKEL